jgi:hypothetical protein
VSSASPDQFGPFVVQLAAKATGYRYIPDTVADDVCCIADSDQKWLL